jgi:hypothetical protein
MARAKTTDIWTMNVIVAFADGTLATTGTHPSRGSSSVVLRLPKGKVPTGIALTTNDELALVSVWDTEKVRGEVAVIALAGPAELGFWGDWNQHYPGLHHYGLISSMKLLGFVELPGMVAPTAIAASADLRWPMIGAPKAAELDLSKEGTRKRFMTGGDLSHRYSRAGFALIMSRSERKVAFLDLEPVMRFFEKNYFGSREAFDKTRVMGPAADQWPYTFDKAPEARPVLLHTRTFEQCPSAVQTTLNVLRPQNFIDPKQDRHSYVSPGFNAHALVATEDGTLHRFAVGGLRDDTPAKESDIVEIGTTPIGRNATAIVHVGLSGQQFEYPVDYAVVARGDRRVDFFRGDKNSGTLTPWKTLEDSRLVDPISADDANWFGNEVPLLAVADYGGKQVLNYRYGDILLHFFGKKKYPMGQDGKAEFECGGAYPTRGGALFVSNTNVP